MNTFIKVEGGTFIRKSNIQFRKGLDFKQITVDVNDFFIADFVVTQTDFEQIMGYNPSHFKNKDLPVECVSWYDAISFCNKKSLVDGLDSCYLITNTRIECDFTKNGYRLPTEAEWEFAALGGIKSRGFIYAGSNSLDDVAWYSKNAGKTTHPRGQKLPNELGLYDMCGNVFEWCWDYFDKFDSEYMDNPKGPVKGTMRVSRGNNWINGASTSELTRRVNRNPYCKTHHQGFRLVRTNDLSMSETKNR